MPSLFSAYQTSLSTPISLSRSHISPLPPPGSGCRLQARAPALNDEVKAYDSLRHLAQCEKAYAALTFCVLKQREVIQSSLRNLLQWGRDSGFHVDELNAKVSEFFLNGELP